MVGPNFCLYTSTLLLDRVSQKNNSTFLIQGLRGATVARLTPDQKVACSSHVGVKFPFLCNIFY